MGTGEIAQRCLARSEGSENVLYELPVELISTPGPTITPSMNENKDTKPLAELLGLQLSVGADPSHWALPCFQGAGFDKVHFGKRVPLLKAGLRRKRGVERERGQKLNLQRQARAFCSPGFVPFTHP